jgi:hypothetical protein
MREYLVGQRVCREEDSEQMGTVTEVSHREVRVEWDGDGISYYQLEGGHVPLKNPGSS